MFDGFGEFCEGELCRGEIHGTEILVSWKAAGNKVSAADLIIARQCGRLDRIPLRIISKNEEIVVESAEFDGRFDVIEISIVVLVDHDWMVIKNASGGYYLGRVLSRNMNEVNKNLRWLGRIEDLDTRFYACRNSIEFSPMNFKLIARCLVSFAYEAIEVEDLDKVQWAFDYVGRVKGHILSLGDAEVRASFFIFWIHLAVWKSDEVLFSEIVGFILGGVLDRGIEQHPVGTFNILCCILICGYFLLEIGDNIEAVEVFERHDKYLRLAFDRFPRRLNNYSELSKTAHRAYLCQVGVCVAKGDKEQLDAAGNPYLKSSIVWSEGCRLKSAGSKRSMAENFSCLIERGKGRRSAGS